MNVSGLFSSSRRWLAGASVAALLITGASVWAQDPAAPPAAPDPLKLTADHVLLWNIIKADKAADFESSWAAIRAGLAKSDKPDLKQLGESIAMYKIDAPPADTAGGKAVNYIFQLNPPVKTQSYDPTKILFFSGAFERAEADAIFAKLQTCYINIDPIPLVKVGQ